MNNTEAYPFIFLNHGSLDLDYVNKNTECYIWFKQEVTSAQRKIVVETCPPPLSGLFVWGECFAYFGSGGDTYDSDIIAAYAGLEICEKLDRILQEEVLEENEIEEYLPYLEDRSVNFPKIKIETIDFSSFDSAFEDLLEICAPRMTEELEKWANKINEITPVAFIKGPHGVEDEDDWNLWSYQQIDQVLNYIIRFIEKSKDSLNGENSLNESQAGDLNDELDEFSNSYDIELLPYSEQIRYFGYIFNDVLSKYSYQTEKTLINSEEREKRLKLADIIYNLDEITSDFEHLSLEEHKIHVNSHIINSGLYGLNKSERIGEIAKLKPYTQLAYYSSYDALKSEDILSHSNPAFYLKELVEQIPMQRGKAITSLLSMIAHNLVKVTPAYQKYDTTHAGEASKIFELLCKRSDALEKDFITATVCCEWAGNAQLGVKISEIGLKKFPKSKQLLHNAISVNNLSNNHERSKELLEVYESVQERPDENFILNKSFNFIKSNKLGEAKELIERYIEQGGEKTPNVLVNLFYTWWMHQSPEKTILESYITEVTEWIKNKAAYQADNLLENFLGLISSKAYYNETIELAEDLYKIKGNISPNCWINYTYAAYFIDEKELKEVAAKMENIVPKLESHWGNSPVVFSNIASIHAKLGDLDKTIHYLKLSNKYNHPNFHALKTDNDFKAYWNEKRFLELFN